MRILIVDDETRARERTARIIREELPDAGIAAFDGPTAALCYVAEDAAAHGADIAFLDIELPGMTGITLAKRLKEYLPLLNIVFVTGHGEYAVEAYDAFPSGFLLKPFTAEKLRRQLENLRSPLPEHGGHIRVQTFGRFDLFVDGKPVHFSRSKSREALAYLVDREGGHADIRQLEVCLLEDGSADARGYMRQIMTSLRRDLKEAGADGILRKDFSGYCVDTSRFSCDLYEYEQGLPGAINRFHQDYLPEYSWGEATLARLYGKNGEA